MKFERFVKNHSAGMIGTLIGIMIVILVAVTLLGTVAQYSVDANNNADLAFIPGGPALVLLLPLIFIVIVIIMAVKKVA